MTDQSTRLRVLRRSARRAVRKVRHQHSAELARIRRLGERLSEPSSPLPSYAGPAHLRALAESYQVRDPLLVGSQVPVVWWTDTPNYGDLLSPWLVGRMTGLPVTHASRGEANYVAVGSVVARANDRSVVWGSGSFGSERRSAFNGRASYRAVRGPLTRSRLLDVGIDCPPVYGDPALLAALYFFPDVAQTHEVGIVIRHSESRWRTDTLPEGVKLIDFARGDVEAVTRELLSCRRILSSSLHGLIIADAYGIPNAWLASATGEGGSRPNGGEFKYFDYFATVDKLRRPHSIDLSRAADLEGALADVSYDDRPIAFDYAALLDACPFLQRR